MSFSWLVYGLFYGLIGDHFGTVCALFYGWFVEYFVA